MPKANKTAATSKASQKMVKVVIKRRPGSVVAEDPPEPAPAPSQSQRRYPWDSHQDDIVVNSVEVPNRTRRLTGVEHYLHQLSQKKDYKEICTDFDEYRRNGTRKVEGLDIDEEVKEEAEQERRGSGHANEWNTDYSKAPVSPSSNNEYDYQIYTRTATNPAIFLAVARIAQRNLPFINFQSAIRHLPNLSHEEQLPQLHHDVLAEDIVHGGDRKRSDDPVTVLFLPRFYHDGRHALGYYTCSQSEKSSASGSSKARMRDLEQMLFTPCTLEDLEMYGLVRYAACSREQDGSGGSETSVQSVGARGGRWLECDKVEDWEEWEAAFDITRVVWEKRLEETRGDNSCS
jgi:hypothetical protein